MERKFENVLIGVIALVIVATLLLSVSFLNAKKDSATPTPLPNNEDANVYKYGGINYTIEDKLPPLCNGGSGGGPPCD